MRRTTTEELADAATMTSPDDVTMTSRGPFQQQQQVAFDVDSGNVADKVMAGISDDQKHIPGMHKLHAYSFIANSHAFDMLIL